MTRLVAKTPKPRNPLVAAAHFRRAGKHGPQAGAMRQAQRQALELELELELSGSDLPRSVRSKPPSL